LERIDAVAERVIKSAKEGHQLVVVVSAMSEVTNTLIEQAEYFVKTPTALVIKEKIKKEMNLNLFCLSNSKIKGIDKNSESIIKK
ncbi:hypothetical protein VWO06_09590, partial [Campylobacter coli]